MNDNNVSDLIMDSKTTYHSKTQRVVTIEFTSFASF